MRARFHHISHLIEEFGLERVREPYVRHLHGPSGKCARHTAPESRNDGRDGISRAIYLTATRRRVIVRVFVKKTEKTPRREIDLARKRAQDGIQ